MKILFNHINEECGKRERLHEMIGDVYFAVNTGAFCLIDNEEKVSPVCVSEQLLDISGKPILDTVFVANEVLKRLMKLGDEFVLHAMTPYAMTPYAMTP